ncbi:terminase gpA endonuclease subunit [Roseovarius pacificus]|uniref:terminase gpA endonuclease subunit n=1 Tax=Roseovarius pacificus TaxID=337701 RepID=UPI0009352BE3|nr:terminase gpA endonuclease subunit [Roseovarius pacificus]
MPTAQRSCFRKTCPATISTRYTERLVTKFSRGHPARVWEVISSRRNEVLDTLAYSYAARQLVGLDMERRESDLQRKDGPKKAPTVVKSAWLER